jgi:hypothetical protein
MKPDRFESDTYVLRWFSGPMALEYRGPNGTYSDQKGAVRFDSAKEARDSVLAEVRFNAYGASDEIGWKVVRLVKKAKS